jgi:hypothetical protein
MACDPGAHTNKKVPVAEHLDQGSTCQAVCPKGNARSATLKGPRVRSHFGSQKRMVAARQIADGNRSAHLV